jgi:crossover junction endodeoxyribonuclease RuvC
MRILGIDPGSVICGYGVVEKDKNNIILIEYGVIKAKKKHETFPLRLKIIFERLTQVIERTMPDESAFETMFYSKNAQTLIKLSYARAAAMLATTMREIPIAEYSPKEIKKSVTGNGNASKEQVQYMVKNLLNISETHEFLDATDALATAICHANKPLTQGNYSSSWKEFIKNNPDKIV